MGEYRFIGVLGLGLLCKRLHDNDFVMVECKRLEVRMFEEI